MYIHKPDSLSFSPQLTPQEFDQKQLTNQTDHRSKEGILKQSGSSHLQAYDHNTSFGCSTGM